MQNRDQPRYAPQNQINYSVLSYSNPGPSHAAEPPIILFVVLFFVHNDSVRAIEVQLSMIGLLVL
jgi:hypothetical protein